MTIFVAASKITHALLLETADVVVDMKNGKTVPVPGLFLLIPKSFCVSLVFVNDLSHKLIGVFSDTYPQDHMRCCLPILLLIASTVRCKRPFTNIGWISISVEACNPGIDFPVL